MVHRIGGSAAGRAPAGATGSERHRPGDGLRSVIARCLELGDAAHEVVPQVEVWGFSKTLGTLGEAAQVAIAADHPKACILADVYHLYKGGSGFHGLKLLGKNAFHVIHMNDYPADPPREKINDADRVYPGDGVAPLKEILADLRAIGFDGMLSIELFNRKYWEQDALTVLRTAIEKTRAVVKSV